MKTKEEELSEGKDAELTDMIYGIQKKPEHRDTDILPESNGLTRGVTDPLQLFINMYQPGEFVTKEHFRKHLLQILREWHHDSADKEERQGNIKVGISLKQDKPHLFWGDKLDGSVFYVRAVEKLGKWLFDENEVVIGKSKSTVGKQNQKQLHADLDKFINKFESEKNG